MHSQSQSYANKLVEDLKKLSPERRHHPFVLRGFKKKAKTLLQNDPFAGYLVLGVIATHEMDIQETRRCHKHALNFGWNLTVYRNYSVALRKLGFFFDSFKYAKKAHEEDPDNLDALMNLIISVFLLGRVHQIRDLIRRWEDISTESNAFFSHLKEATSIIITSGIADNDIVKIHNIVAQLFHDHNLYIHNIKFQINRENERWIQHQYELDISPGELIELEYQLGVYLSRLPEDVVRTIQIELITEDPFLDKFIEYVENDMLMNPEEVIKVDQDQIARIARLVGNEKVSFQLNIWTTYYYRLFKIMLDQLEQNVRILKDKFPNRYKEHPKTRLLSAIYDSIKHEIPANPNDRQFFFEKYSGAQYSWRRVKSLTLPRYSLFFRFDRFSKSILFAWFNDSEALRKAPDDGNLYNYYKKMMGKEKAAASISEIKTTPRPTTVFTPIVYSGRD